MPSFIVLGSNHTWVACYNWNEVRIIADKMFRQGCEYVKVIRTDEAAHWINKGVFLK